MIYRDDIHIERWKVNKSRSKEAKMERRDVQGEDLLQIEEGKVDLGGKMPHIYTSKVPISDSSGNLTSQILH